MGSRKDIGDIIIGAYSTNHVFMVLPGGMLRVVNNYTHTNAGILQDRYRINPILEEGDKWGYSFLISNRNTYYVPRILECGANIKSNKAPLSSNMDYTNSLTIKWYKYIK
jgi:hypothetical protein